MIVAGNSRLSQGRRQPGIGRFIDRTGDPARASGDAARRRCGQLGAAIAGAGSALDAGVATPGTGAKFTSESNARAPFQAMQ